MLPCEHSHGCACLRQAELFLPAQRAGLPSSSLVNWESVKEDTITAYTHEFTEPELKKLTEFYKTPVGKKASEKMPQLAFIAGQIGLRQAQVHQTELLQMLEAQKNKPGGGG